MNYEIIHSATFTAKAQKARLSMEDIREIENDIMAHSAAYPVMVGTNTRMIAAAKAAFR